MGGKEMKNKLFAMLCSAAMALSGIAGYVNMARADNDRYEYSFYNGNTQGNSGQEEKATNRKVYIHPVSGPGLKYTVQGRNDGTAWHNRSTQKTIYSGSTVKVTNYVYANNETWARLHYVRTTTAYTNTIGYWNPDPS